MNTHWDSAQPTRPETAWALVWRTVTIAALLLALAAFASAQECQTGDDVDPGTKSAIESTAQQFFQLVQAGNSAGLQQQSIPTVASSFAGIQAAISENAQNFKGATASPKGVYLLNALGTQTIARAEFFCGIFNSPDRVSFVVPNLPPGQYAVVIENVQGGKNPTSLSMILQNSGGWKLAGFYVRPLQIAGHDGSWYLAEARKFKASGDTMAAYFYYLAAWQLTAPVDFMSTPQLDRLAGEIDQARLADLPSPQKPMPLAAGTKTYQVTQMFALPVGDVLDLVVRYQVPSVADTGQVYQDNLAVMRAIVAKYPAFRNAFGAIVARGTEASGNDYGTLLAMKDIK